jgi:hypothetical protein
MTRRRSDDDPHRLVHVLAGALAGIGIGLITGFVAMQAVSDLLNILVGSAYVGDSTIFIGFVVAIFLGLQVGMFCSRSVTDVLRDAGTFTSWLFLISLLVFTIFVSREAYLRGFLPGVL